MSARRLLARVCAAAFLATACVGSTAWAQAIPAPSQEIVSQVRSAVLDHLTEYSCDHDVKCTAATPAERANPPVTDAEGGLIVQRGMISGLAAHCDLDWKTRNFFPMMSYWRHGQKKSERQMAIIAGMHGVSQGATLEAVEKQACTPEIKQRIDAMLDFKP